MASMQIPGVMWLVYHFEKLPLIGSVITDSCNTARKGNHSAALCSKPVFVVFKVKIADLRAYSVS